MSERVTWESCPGCGGLAAVGWLGGDVVEFDCVDGCCLTEQQEAVVRERPAPPLPSARGHWPPTTHS
jgi:hypothetical protein